RLGGRRRGRLSPSHRQQEKNWKEPFHWYRQLDAQIGIVAARGSTGAESWAPLRLDGHPTSTAPPFTLKTSPVMKPACSVQRKRMGAAISSGLPTRPKGISRRISSPLRGSSRAGRDMSVSTQPGATEFT